MPRQDLHKKPYDEGTQEKLHFYRDYLREWLYVFANTPSVDTLQIFDFFAGPGSDTEGNLGSPGIACEELCKAFDQGQIRKKINLFFNEKKAEKYEDLKSFLDKQKQLLPQVEFFEKQCSFHTAFEQWEPHMKSHTANLLFLDQSGLDQITKPIFKSIVQKRFTDFIFFISSSVVQRFQNNPEIREKVPIRDEDLSAMNRKNVHRILANSYRRWIPEKMQYFLGSFSLKKGANVYGLVFGSGHPLGIDKFLKIAWNHDKNGGDANFDIDDDKIDPMKPSLFPQYDIPTKIKVFKNDLEKAILPRRLTTNKDIYIFGLQNGMLASHARDALNEMVKNEKLPKQNFHVSYDAWSKSMAESIQHFTGEDK